MSWMDHKNVRFTCWQLGVRKKWTWDLFLLKLRTLYATSATHKTVTMCISKQGNMVTVFVHSTKKFQKVEFQKTCSRIHKLQKPLEYERICGQNCNENKSYWKSHFRQNKSTKAPILWSEQTAILSAKLNIKVIPQ